MSDLITQLAEVLVFRRRDKFQEVLSEYDMGQAEESARLQPLHKLLVELASAADRLGNCCAEFDDLHYCAEYFQALDDKVQALRTQLSKEGV